MEKRSSKLWIETNGEQANAEICGTPAEIMFNWAALTNQICLKLHLSPTQLAFMLPGLLGRYQRTLRQATEFDFTALRKQAGGDKT